MSLNLTGIPNDSPTPRVTRQFNFAQGDSLGAGDSYPILLVGNKLAAGSEAVETLGDRIQDLNDCYVRFGRKSEIAWQYRAIVASKTTAPVSAIAVAENGSAAASSVLYTFTNTATAASTLRVEWGGRRLEVVIAVGDTAIVQAAALAAKINADPDLPFTAAQQAPANDHKVLVTCSNLGPRGTYVMKALRVYYAVVINSTVAKAAVTAGTGADDVTNALLAIKQAEFYYHAIAATIVWGDATPSITTTDGGLGQYLDQIRSQFAPSSAKDQQVFIGLDCAQSVGTYVGIGANTNSVLACFCRVKNNDWTPAMVAAHVAGVKRELVAQYPAANMSGYTNSDSTPFAIPDPYVKSDRPTDTEIAADLNNGITPIAFTPQGAAKIVRQITSYNYLPGTTQKDYRAREGHIPDVEIYAWHYLRGRWYATKQPNIASDVVQGKRPLKLFNTPKSMRDLLISVIDVLSSNACPANNAAILDPSADAVKRMKDSVFVEARAAGFGVSVDWEVARHDLFDDFLISQGGPGY